MRKLLIISFSDLRNDARVLKQIAEFTPDFEVITCGYGEPPQGSDQHFTIPEDCVYWAYPKADLILRRYRRAYWANRAVEAAMRQLRGQEIDLVIANDLDTVPLALSLEAKNGVHADLHEYAPREKEELLRWRLFVAPFREWLCRTYLPQCVSITTVGPGIAAEYSKWFGVDVGVVMNSTPPANMPTRATGRPIKLVHSGACLRGRGIGVILEAMASSTADLTLDLYLMPNDPGYMDELIRNYGGDERICFHDPVAYAQLIETLNQYDVGVHVLEPISFNHQWALPNKLFDYVQARLGVVIGPSPEMAAVVEKFGLGQVTAGFASDDVRDVFDSLTVGHVDGWKQNADAAAHRLSSASQVSIWRDYVERAMVGK